MIHKFMFATMLLVGIAASGSLAGEGLELDHGQVQRCYLDCLNSNNEGVRNSAIFCVMKYIESNPEHCSPAYINRLREMSHEDPVLKNRVYAFIAFNVLTDPGKAYLAIESPPNEEGKDAYFIELQAMLHSSFLAAYN